MIKYVCSTCGEKKPPTDSPTDTNDFSKHGNRVVDDSHTYIPVHTACLDIAKRVQASSPRKHIGDIRVLYLALHLRWGERLNFEIEGTRPEWSPFGLKRWYTPLWEWLGNLKPIIKAKEAGWAGPSPSGAANVGWVSLDFRCR